MNEYLELGKINRLKVARETDHGLVLASEKEKEVLLPKAYVTESMKVGDELDVFVYTDSEDRIVATTERPKAMLGELAEMEVVDTTQHGAFVDWGLPKDLFVPKMFQREPMRKGERHLIYVAYDERTHRLVGTQKFDRVLERSPKDLKRNQEVELFVYAKTDLGYKVVVDRKYDGLVFHSEVFEPIEIGKRTKGYVKIVRDDGKIDILLRPIGKKSDTLAAEKVLAYLNDHKGMMPLNYKSDPERIKALLGLSRKNFKRALTKLIETGKIEVKENGTFLKTRSGK
ncbi:CvfB family protein [Hydrogenimonas cancrithermarum]|uniref:GntR family transcriptional regulator n=1 Tax=Hydrogenimonas cancrithermarum TaxID=2993563 RepID=A0ABM8FLY6_9BACT|nr:S1-like domain-containing RNA-binding protein [Hydrogenimonas cancrithermarum]BDY13342.1 GntR family transcriptional regulator [Hydrogenimonas cancrithermarum]